ncbi:12077_t:CDS:10 [Acaulospora morrowiae]|uniref:12077_t:CDS:1 n=1 Tax=Acaulospora morrowiae TaxID=94023 RepID=A0A9N9A5D2_9GLOM|nr:12077_t:CDS:10 [Acaulospora morrowiae]
MKNSRVLLLALIILALLQVFVGITVADEWDEEENNEATVPLPVPVEESPIIEVAQEPKPLNIFVRPQYKLSDFYREIFVIVTIVTYILNYIMGKRANEKIARKWMETHYQLFAENFAQVGNDKGNALIMDGPADYLFYLTGRRNCQYIHGRITLKPRHDLLQTITNFIMSQFSSNYIVDSVTYHAYMNDKDYDDFVFALTKKEKAGDLRKSRYDLGDFTRQSNSNLLPNAMNLHSESLEITDTILTNKVVELVKTITKYLNAVIITDQPRIRPEKSIENRQKLITIISELPNSSSKFEETIPVSELLMFLIDWVPSKCTFRGETKAKITKNREEAEKKIQKGLEYERQEAIQQKKAEKKRAEAERVAKLSPEEQRKM